MQVGLYGSVLFLLIDVLWHPCLVCMDFGTSSSYHLKIYTCMRCTNLGISLGMGDNVFVHTVIHKVHVAN